MNKWTVIIPTLWKSEYIHEQLKEYIWSDYISEIILIDNSSQYYDHHKKIYNKVKLIQPDENLFVNPSWNLGVEKSSNENIIIANDDILWNTQVLEQITDKILNEYSVLGQIPENYIKGKNIEFIKENKIKTLEFIDNNTRRPTAWGCLLFTTKTNWKPIPNELKIWYGDDWIITKSKSKTGKIKNMLIGGAINASETPEFSGKRNQDRINFKKL